MGVRGPPRRAPRWFFGPPRHWGVVVVADRSATASLLLLLGGDSPLLGDRPPKPKSKARFRRTVLAPPLLTPAPSAAVAAPRRSPPSWARGGRPPPPPSRRRRRSRPPCLHAGASHLHPDLLAAPFPARRLLDLRPRQLPPLPRPLPPSSRLSPSPRPGPRHDRDPRTTDRNDVYKARFFKGSLFDLADMVAMKKADLVSSEWYEYRHDHEHTDQYNRKVRRAGGEVDGMDRHDRRRQPH